MDNKHIVQIGTKRHSVSVYTGPFRCRCKIYNTRVSTTEIKKSMHLSQGIFGLISIIKKTRENSVHVGNNGPDSAELASMMFRHILGHAIDKRVAI